MQRSRFHMSEVPGRESVRCGSAGFTLLELLVVMGIMVLLMAIGVAGFFGIRRGTEFRGAVSMVQNAMILARQQAVTKHSPVQLGFDKGGGRMSMTMGASRTVVHSDFVLPVGVAFDEVPGGGSTGTLVFSPVGDASAAGAVGQSTIKLLEKTMGKDGWRQTASITVWLVTGVTQVSLGKTQ